MSEHQNTLTLPSDSPYYTLQAMPQQTEVKGEYIEEDIEDIKVESPQPSVMEGHTPSSITSAIYTKYTST